MEFLADNQGIANFLAFKFELAVSVHALNCQLYYGLAWAWKGLYFIENDQLNTGNFTELK